MAPSFPLPRSALPTVRVTPDEHKTAKHMMGCMLEHTVQAFENFAYDAQGVVDTARWKPLGVQDDLKLYRERVAGATSSGLAAALGPRAMLPNSDSVAALAGPTMMMTGCCPGSVAGAMGAAISQTQDDLSLLVNFMHEDVADCAVIHTMESPSPDKPFHYLGYKYFVRRSPGAPGLVKHRDSLYLEFSGTTRTRQGEVLGFVLLHSVNLPQFPGLTKYNSIRALQSVRYLYRQRSHEVVEVFMLGNLDISGMVIKPIADRLAQVTLFALVRLTDCAEAKRLTHMVRHRRPSVAVRSRHPDSDECQLCGKTSKRSTLVSAGAPKRLSKCEACGCFACPHCRDTKRIYVPNPDHILGKFQKVQICMTCVIEANESPEESPLPLPTTRPLRASYASAGLPTSQRRTTSTTSSGDSAYPLSGRSDGPYPLSGRSDTSISAAVASVTSELAGMELELHAGRPKSSSYSSCSSGGSYSSAIEITTPVARTSPTELGNTQTSSASPSRQGHAARGYTSNCRGGIRSRQRSPVASPSPTEKAEAQRTEGQAKVSVEATVQPATSPTGLMIHTNSAGKPPVPIATANLSPLGSHRLSPGGSNRSSNRSSRSQSVGASSTSCSPQEAMYARLLELNDVAEQTSAYVSSRGHRMS
ncbi:hypothetical protein BBJ28_00001638 [Nothophytophthora sp. Chile5]|nr:hypothetical protein BBJ28_00001638 [Nothophytophthora sp. Chile5]